jgi:hypothetical protein
MDVDRHQPEANPGQRFRSVFQRRLSDYTVRCGAVAEGFGLVWEQMLGEVAVDDRSQAILYRDLIEWTRSDKLLAGADSIQLLEAWRQAFHEAMQEIIGDLQELSAALEWDSVNEPPVPQPSVPTPERSQAYSYLHELGT